MTNELDVFKGTREEMLEWLKLPLRTRRLTTVTAYSMPLVLSEKGSAKIEPSDESVKESVDPSPERTRPRRRARKNRRTHERQGP
jgi:hypothetical protein